ncbi:MAG: hypothetical protein OER86_07825 [Phycisphaerae bacterium]|nr:hypothetical protein [Phycisphaerae bacterium]
MDGLKDSSTTIMCAGILAPVGLTALSMYNLLAWKVFWPHDGEDITPFDVTVYTGTWHVVGTVIFKLGLAGVLLSWFCLANFDRTDRYAQLMTVTAGIIGLVGGIIACVGFFV